MSKTPMELPDLGQKGDTFTLTREQYSRLLQKASGFEGQTEFFAKIREMIEPTEKDTRLPWYDMLLKCINNKQIKNYISRLIEERDKLQAFKQYTHDRLDGMGIEPNPEGEHSAAGCRIGDRMYIVERLIAEHKMMKETIEFIAKNNPASACRMCKTTLKQLEDGK